MVVVALVGVALLVGGLVGRDIRRVAGALVFLLAVVPWGLSARVQPGWDDDRFRSRLWAELGWTVLAIAVCASGLVLYGR